MKLLPCVLCEKYIYILARPAQGTALSQLYRYAFAAYVDDDGKMAEFSCLIG